MIWWVVGGIGGAVVAFGAYALTHQDDFNWKQALLWTGGGAVVGATLGAGAHLVAGALGAEAAATAGGTAATLGAAASSPASQRSILWLENQLVRVQHIMAQKHAWDRLVTLSGNLQQDYQAVQPLIRQVIDSGTMRSLGTNSQGQQIVEFIAKINNEQVIVRAIQTGTNVIQISDAWVVR